MYAPGDELQKLKSKQIDSLRQHFPTVREVQREVIYEVQLTLPSRKNLLLRINLPRDFPKVPPTLQVFPEARHPLIDPQMFIIPQAHENLSRWPIHASLGKTVYDLAQKFLRDPPQLIQQQPVQAYPPPPNQQSGNSYQHQNQVLPYPTSGGGVQPRVYSTSANSSNPFGSGVGTSLPYPVNPVNEAPLKVPIQMSFPSIPNSFPELESKTPAELSQILNDENEFKKFFESLSSVQTMKKLRDDLRNNKEELAKKNLAKETEIEKLKKEMETNNQVVNEKRAEFEHNVQKQQEVMKQFSNPALIEQLTKGAYQAEIESDEIANKFLSSEIDQKEFVKNFMEKRKFLHLRSAKKESLAMLKQ